jgi:hypothetical protein
MLLTGASSMTLNNAKIKAGTALRPVIEAFHIGDGQLLTFVSEVYEDSCLTRIVFAFERNTLTVAANAEDDNVALSVTNPSGRLPPHDASDREPWVSIIRELFRWGWRTLNQQGYCDGVLLSFRRIIPRFVLTVEASSLSSAP